ncbi:hypothetical protein [Deinococcus planocerae]|uniref:hypothetical protein n=1 Tax=Deinococcus planocerae TaxID=1737569 RepID=UPI0011AEDE48|nr:hypothetical protein [Deinococcus planocerae]
MQDLAFNVLLAAVWALFVGEVSLRELAVGASVGIVVMPLRWQGNGAPAMPTTFITLMPGTVMVHRRVGRRPLLCPRGPDHAIDHRFSPSPPIRPAGETLRRD